MTLGFGTRLWWEHEWYSCMANSKDWRSKKVNVVELNCKVVKKVATPHFYINPPLFKFIPPFSQKNSFPPSDSIFGRSYPLPPTFNKVQVRGGGFGGWGPTMWFGFCFWKWKHEIEKHLISDLIRRLILIYKHLFLI